MVSINGTTQQPYLAYDIINNNEIHLILNAILNGTIEIEELIRKIPLNFNLQGETTNINFSGDNQKTLDIISNDILINNFDSFR